ncbi:hypothetical protein VNO77_20485 [Canavalia gladiata]|uniref:Uncharacterized protein n=1 Tax=Canavalia gladiata TaxID=3824 RepID=A0AAN9QJE1_CANGL
MWCQPLHNPSWELLLNHVGEVRNLTSGAPYLSKIPSRNNNWKLIIVTILESSWGLVIKWMMDYYILSLIETSFKAKSGYVIRAGLSWSPNVATDTKP